MKPITSINPFTLEILREFEELSEFEISQKLNTSQKAFLHWRDQTFDLRSELMMKLADLLDQNAMSLARTITGEMGKIKAESLAEVKKCAWVCRYYAENAENFLKEENLGLTEADSYIAYDPMGIILAIMPWNFPFWQVFRFAAPGIMAGNVGILKHASNVPQCALAIESLFLEAGFPEGVFQSLLIGSGKVNRIIDDNRVKGITLTGSDIAGRKVGERAGNRLKKTVLELGGSDPFIVLKDADIDTSVITGVKARMFNCGQSCIAAKRFIIEEAVSEEFIQKFTQKFNKLEGGDPWGDDIDYGPIARRDLSIELFEQVKESLILGADVLTDRRFDEGNPAMYPATVLGGVKSGMPAFDDELFGPVASVIIAKDEKHAIDLANNSRFGLGASLWTRDLDKGKILARKIESGSVFINAMVASHPMVPFGGIKDSGYGRELSYIGIREFMNLKSVWVNRN